MSRLTKTGRAPKGSTSHRSVSLLALRLLLGDGLGVVLVLPLFVGTSGVVPDVALAVEADEVAHRVVVTDDLRSGFLDVLLARGGVHQGLEADAEHEVTDLGREVGEVRDRGVVARPQVYVDERGVGVVHAVQMEDGNDRLVLHRYLLEGEVHSGPAEQLEVLGSEIVDVVFLSSFHGTNKN